MIGRPQDCSAIVRKPNMPVFHQQHKLGTGNFQKTNLLMEVANEIRDKRNEPLVRRESVKKFHGAIP
jgi:hypothetical protein